MENIELIWFRVLLWVSIYQNVVYGAELNIAPASATQVEVEPPTGMHFRTPNASLMIGTLHLGVSYRKY